jgi:hypothetical protein
VGSSRICCTSRSERAQEKASSIRSSKDQRTESPSSTTTRSFSTKGWRRGADTAPKRETVPYSKRWWKASETPTDPRLARNRLAYIGSSLIMNQGKRFQRSSARARATSPVMTGPGSRMIRPTSWSTRRSIWRASSTRPEMRSEKARNGWPGASGTFTVAPAPASVNSFLATKETATPRRW